MLPESYFTEINKTVNVSRETFSKLEEFIELLLKWNKSINLVSKAHSTKEDIWTRHIVDSLQLLKYIPEDAKIVTDFGSGGGFPGVILAIAGWFEVHLVESDHRKCAFLREATRGLPNKVTIHNDRIERITPWESDVITARALASLDKLLKLIHPFYQKNTLCIFLKGQNVVEEIKEASKYWDISHEIHPSISSDSGRILEISNLKDKGSKHENS